MSALLAGVRVLDLSRVLAGPWATQLFADLGAEVIKVERPGSGDETRRWGPPFLTSTDTGEPGDAAYFLCANRNKRSVAIDFSQSEGADLVRRLALDCDIVVENFRVGSLAAYGLDAARLRAAKPSLVYVSITGFGQTGPDAARPGYDYVIQAMSGLMSITGERDGPPTKVGVAVSDLATGLYAAAGALAALHRARATGEGAELDIALFDCQAALLANQATNYFVSGRTPERLGDVHPNLAPYQTFKASDGVFVLAIGADAQFVAACHAIGEPDLADDPRFATNAGRLAAREELANRFAQRFATRDRTFWIERLTAVGAPAGPVQTIAEAFDGPNAQARGLVQTLQRPNGEIITAPACPVRVGDGVVERPTAPPLLGADTDAVLTARCGLDPDQLEGLRARGVIG